jgi:hypothetical protein
MRTCFVCLIAVLACTAICAVGNPALGKWNCSSVGENGTKLNWTLVVTEDAGKLAAMATLDGTNMPLLDPKVEGNTLTFKLQVNEHELVSFKLYIDGDKLTGRFEGKDSGKATITGTRAT